jgi:ATP-dependent DNA helicase RecG
MLHGKMKSAEKSAVMRAFCNNEFGILAATSVIEVGIDVSNATVMVIENAERFGLAQLHQLRGRVGRGAELSYCVLISNESTKDSWRRLKIMEESTDGFRLAEEDFNIRGPGNILGTEQSGLPPLILADLIRDRDILARAREDAKRRIEADPDLKNEPALREALALQRSEHLAATTN